YFTSTPFKRARFEIKPSNKPRGTPRSSAGKENRPFDALREFSNARGHDYSEDEESEGEPEEEESDWDEETLVSLLKQSPTLAKTQNTVAELVDSLQPAFTKAAQTRKEDIAKVLLPTMRRVRNVHAQLNEQGEIFAESIIGLADVCRAFEEIEFDDGEMARAVQSSQQKVAPLLAELEKRLANRAKIDEKFKVQLKEKGNSYLHYIPNSLLSVRNTDLSSFVDPTADAMRDRLNATPKDVSKLLTSSEKKSKQFDKDDAEAAQQMLKQLKIVCQKDSGAFSFF
ncbi:hypothetical protein EWM64_g9239, partial [Hericium alpestre]